MLSLLILLPSAFNADTVIVQSSGYNTVLTRGFWESAYFERMLSSQLGVSLSQWSSSNWDSLSKNLNRINYGVVDLTYRPVDWFSLTTGINGSKTLTTESDGTEGYERHASYAYLNTVTTKDLLYTHFKASYGNERVALYGPGAGWSFDTTMQDYALFMVRTAPCTLSFYHNREIHSNWSDKGDTFEISLSSLPFFKSGFLSGASFGKREARGFSDYDELGALAWIRDTLSLSPRIKLDFSANYSIDTLVNNSFMSSSYKETERNLDATMLYQVLRYTSLRLLFSTDNTLHDQSESYYDYNKTLNTFTSTINHNFTRRPSYARSTGSEARPLSPGSMYFSHTISLERFDTPDTLNNLDHDKFTEKANLSTSLNLWTDFTTNFKLNHSVTRTHYVRPAYAASSNLRRSSQAAWDCDLNILSFSSIANSASLSFDWTEYYTDSSNNRADRTWSDIFELTLFPKECLRPDARVSWKRYENWRMISGDLKQSAIRDEIEQRYSLSYISLRKEEAPKWYQPGWWSRQWLTITGFVGLKQKLFPSDGQALTQSSHFAGIEANYYPWPYLTISGGFKFIRSDYEAPLEASLSIYGSF